jgi:hypothetical protein
VKWFAAVSIKLYATASSPDLAENELKYHSPRRFGGPDEKEVAFLFHPLLIPLPLVVSLCFDFAQHHEFIEWSNHQGRGNMVLPPFMGGSQREGERASYHIAFSLSQLRGNSVRKDSACGCPQNLATLSLVLSHQGMNRMVHTKGEEPNPSSPLSARGGSAYGGNPPHT